MFFAESLPKLNQVSENRISTKRKKIQRPYTKLKNVCIYQVSIMKEKSSLEKFSRFAFLPAIVWTLFILLVSWTVAGINLPERLLDLISTDKVAHFIVYSILTCLYLLGFFIKGKEIKFYPLGLFVITAASLYGVMMEILQYYFFPGRFFEILDIVANISGAFAGFYLFRLCKNIINGQN
ncbi:MAG: VanZ family protein [Saprospiraceae bacterium]|nr:VanZ family protein [Saprospiraceae bacterium]